MYFLLHYRLVVQCCTQKENGPFSVILILLVSALATEHILFIISIHSTTTHAFTPLFLEFHTVPDWSQEGREEGQWGWLIFLRLPELVLYSI